MRLKSQGILASWNLIYIWAVCKQPRTIQPQSVRVFKSPIICLKSRGWGLQQTHENFTFSFSSLRGIFWGVCSLPPSDDFMKDLRAAENNCGVE